MKNKSELAAKAKKHSADIQAFFKKNQRPLPARPLSISSSEHVFDDRYHLLVGLFRGTEGTDDIPLAYTLILRTLLSDLKSLGFAEHINLPSMNNGTIYDDLSGQNEKVSSEFTSDEHFKHKTKLYGCQYVVTGEVYCTKDQFQIILEWNEAATMNLMTQKTLVCSSRSELVLKSALWIISQLGMVISKSNFNALKAQLDEHELEQTVNICRAYQEDESYVPSIQLSACQTLPLALMIFAEQLRKINHKVVTAALKTINDKFNNHSQLLMQLSMMSICSQTNSKTKKLISQALLDKFEDNPSDRLNLMQCIHQHNDAKQYEEAIALGLFAIQRHPHQHHYWWSLSIALCQCAWEYRGNGWWNSVSEDNQDRFEFLTDEAAELSDVALEMHPLCAVLLNDKINFENGFTDWMWEYFNRSVEADPKFKQSYHSALNFSQPRWGGYLEAQLFIIKLAYEHFPNDKFPLSLLKEYVLLNQDYGLFTRIKCLFKYITNPQKLFDEIE